MGVAGRSRSGSQAEFLIRADSSKRQRRKYFCGDRILWTFQAIVYQTASVYPDAVKMFRSMAPEPEKCT